MQGSAQSWQHLQMCQAAALVKGVQGPAAATALPVEPTGTALLRCCRMQQAPGEATPLTSTNWWELASKNVRALTAFAFGQAVRDGRVAEVTAPVYDAMTTQITAVYQQVLGPDTDFATAGNRGARSMSRCSHWTRSAGTGGALRSISVRRKEPSCCSGWQRRRMS